jgi:hypothetical protein
MTTDDWNALVSDFLESTFAARPDIAVNAGRHDFDGRLPDWSQDGLRREVARLREWEQRVTAADASQLDAALRLERDAILAVIDGMRFWLEAADWPRRNPAWYADALDPDVYLSRPYAPLEQRMRAYVDYARAVPTAVDRIRGNLHPPFPRTWIDRASNAYGGLASFCATDVPGVFAAVSNPGLHEEFATANAAAVAAFRDLERWLETQRESQTSQFALGADLFRQMLWRTERVDTPLDALARMARADLDRNLAALHRVCAEWAPALSTRECVERVVGNKPTQSPVDEARDQLAMLRAFVEEHDLVSIPGDEQALVAESPPYMRWNIAYIMIPGPYERNMPSTYYIAPPDPAWTAAERAAYLPGRADLLFVSVHEVWPGHFLQFLHANRAPSRVSQVFVGYGFAEGWAHYAEEMTWDAGLGAGDPETHIGLLLNALLRNVRFVASLGLHTGGMTVDEAERLFVEEGFQDAANARQQAARGTFDPAYLNYTLGKLLIRDLRDDWMAARNGAGSLREFHDALLRFGGPPIPLVRSYLSERH